MAELKIVLSDVGLTFVSILLKQHKIFTRLFVPIFIVSIIGTSDIEFITSYVKGYIRRIGKREVISRFQET